MSGGPCIPVSKVFIVVFFLTNKKNTHSLSLAPSLFDFVSHRSAAMVVLSTLALVRAAYSLNSFVFEAEDIRFGSPWWFVVVGVACFLVLFAGIMSGLTLGLMSLGLVELEILQQSGSSAEKKQAGTPL